MHLLPLMVKPASELTPGEVILTEDGSVVVLQIHFPDCLCDHDGIIVLGLGVNVYDFMYFEVTPSHNVMVVGI